MSQSFQKIIYPIIFYKATVFQFPGLRIFLTRLDCLSEDEIKIKLGVVYFIYFLNKIWDRVQKLKYQIKLLCHFLQQ